MSKRIKAGNTAFITGATSGIGEVFARKLGAMGLNLILVARRIELLEKIKSEIESKNDVNVQVFSADLSNSDWAEQIPEINQFDIDLLINNAGTGYPGEFGIKNFDFDRKLIQLNCITPLELTHLFLPKMKQKKSGGIIYVSSTMGMQGIPYMAQYSATKGYLLNFGESLYTECKKYNVAIEVLLPGATETEGSNLYDIDYEKLPISWMKPEEVVETSIQNFGKSALIIPGKRNILTAGISTFMCSRNHIQKIINRFAKKVIKNASIRVDNHTQN
jgi:uncharacterized protein